MFDRLNSLEGGMEKHTSSIKYREEEGDFIIKFVYKSLQATTGNFFTMNTLIVSSTGEGNYKVELQSLGTQEWVHFVGSMIRRFTMEYSTKN